MFDFQGGRDGDHSVDSAARAQGGGRGGRSVSANLLDERRGPTGEVFDGDGATQAEGAAQRD